MVSDEGAGELLISFQFAFLKVHCVSWFSTFSFFPFTLHPGYKQVYSAREQMFSASLENLASWLSLASTTRHIGHVFLQQHLF